MLAGQVMIFIVESQDHFLIGMGGTATDDVTTALKEETAAPSTVQDDSPSLKYDPPLVEDPPGRNRTL